MSKLIIKKDSSRHYKLNLPSAIVIGMNWENEIVDLIPEPEENKVILEGKSSMPVGFSKFIQNINRAKWLKDKKKYLKGANQLTKEEKELKYSFPWQEVEDGGYLLLAKEYKHILKLESTIKSTSSYYREEFKKYIESFKSYWQKRLKHIEEYGGKKPEWFNMTFEKKKKN